MALYKYRAKETPQKIVEGTLEAPTKEEALRKIEAMGYFPINLEEISGAQPHFFLKKIQRKVRHKDITLFSKQLATLIKSGVPILKALGIIAEQSQNSYFQSIVKEMFNHLKEGEKLSTALAKYPKIFSPFYIAMVEVGEDSGNLDALLLRVTEYRKTQESIISKVQLALMYPLIMAIVGLGTIIFMLTFVMPRLMKIFIGLGQDLPLPTKILLNISNFITHWKGIILIAVIVVFMLVRQEFKRKAGKRVLSVFKLKVPFLGEIILKREMARLSRTLELLIKSGIPILKAIELTAPIINNEIIREKFLEGHRELAQGSSLGKTLKSFKIFPSFMTNLIAIGEESGNLDLSLSELADAYERDIDDLTKAFTTILEPLMILAMGLIIGFVVIAMLLPVFQINLAIR